MSDDIKARLRAVAEATGPNEARDIAFEAADRIEALEAENARLRSDLFRAGQRFHAITRASQLHQIQAAADSWAWECHGLAGTRPQAPHPIFEEVTAAAIREDKT